VFDSKSSENAASCLLQAAALHKMTQLSLISMIHK